MKFLYKTSSLIDDQEIRKTVETLSDYITHLKDVANHNNYESDEASINLPFDQELKTQIKILKDKKNTNELKYIIVIGIGGSNLGTKAMYDGFFGYYDVIQPHRFPKMIFLDTQDEEVLFKTTELIKTLQSKEEIIINAISKSGGTTETAANLEVIYYAFTKKFGDINDRIIITTDEGSKMQKAAEEKGIAVLNLPQKVGGRYSVFSAVGMLPLSLAGCNIEAIRSASQRMRDLCLKNDYEKNPALISASILYLLSQEDKKINDNFIFLPQLESLGKWYRQLMGESIGKEGKGITPTVSIGSTDLHSVGQLYLGGPKDKITTFIYSENTKYEVIVPDNTAFNLVDAIKGKQIPRLMQAIMGGTKAAYLNQGLPFMEIILDTVSEESIAEFMQFKMMEMMYLGKLMDINTFDQPHVELYKTETKKLLSQ